MKTGQCRCGNRIYFNNVRCVACNATLGRCGCCDRLASFNQSARGIHCDGCQATVRPCKNRDQQACNSMLDGHGLCRWCEFTTQIPDLTSPSNVRRWSELEAAKRRLLLQLEDLQFPPFVADTQSTHPLSFQFLEDSVAADGTHRQVTTGHFEGLITINLAEADSVHRERTRVQLGEPQRTVIGHMRHEIGHYIDWSWATRIDRAGYLRLFGDPASVDYAEAMDRHYRDGAPNDWANNHVSAYATMHPWEDFAETVNAYLDIMAIAATANDQGRSQFDLSGSADASSLVHSVLDIVVEVSEYNLDLGLQPLFPERLPPPVIKKLAYVHSLRDRRQMDLAESARHQATLPS